MDETNIDTKIILDKLNKIEKDHTDKLEKIEKTHKKNFEKIEKSNKELKETNEKLEKEIVNLKNLIIKPQKCTNMFVNLIIEGKNIPVEITPFGQESLEKISSLMVRKCCSNLPRSLSCLNNMLSFDKNKMENWNVLRYDDSKLIYLNEKHDWNVSSYEDFADKAWTIRENQLDKLVNKNKFNDQHGYVIKKFHNEKVKLYDNDLFDKGYRDITTKDLCDSIQQKTLEMEIHINQKLKDI